MQLVSKFLFKSIISESQFLHIAFHTYMELHRKLKLSMFCILNVPQNYQHFP